jgi:hypothetical protein
MGSLAGAKPSGGAMEAHIQSAVAGSAQPSSDAALGRVEDHTATLLAALGGFAAIAINTALMLGARRGLPNHPWLIVLALGYGALFIGCSVTIEICVTDALRRTLTQLLALVALLLLPIAVFGTTLWLFAAFAGLAAWIAIARGRLAAVRVQPRLIVWLGVALCCVVAIGLYGLAGFQHRELQAHFLMPEYARLGLLHKDPLTFVSFAAQIMNGRWPGAALDGMRPIFYHFGVPLIVASLARATESLPFHVYMAGQQVLFVPLVVFYASLAASALARCAGAPIPVRALSVVLGAAAVLVVPALNWPVVYYSEASSASAAFAFLMVPLAAAWLASAAGGARAIGPALAVIAAALASALFKLSIAMMIGALTCYLILRQRLSQRASDVTAMTALVLAVGLAAALGPAVFGRAFAFPLWAQDGDYFRLVLREAVWALSALAAIFVLERLCRALRCDLAPTRPVWHALLVMFPVAVAGTWLIANVHHLYDGRYLFNTLLLLTLPLIALGGAALVHAASLTLAHPVAKGATLPVLAILLVLMTALGMQAGRAAPSRTVARIDAAIAALCGRAVPEAACRAHLPRAFRAAPAELAAALDGGLGPRILALPKRSPARDALFVPPGNEAYWRFVLGGDRPTENLNFLPAHFGLPMLLGLPPTAYGVDTEPINAVLFGRYDESARSRPLSDRELCQHAQERAIERVQVLESLEPSEVRALDCRITLR